MVKALLAFRERVRLRSERSEVKISGGQIEHSVVNGLPPLQHFFEKKLCCPGTMTRRWAQSTCTLRRITASIMKDLISRKFYFVTTVVRIFLDFY